MKLKPGIKLKKNVKLKQEEIRDARPLNERRKEMRKVRRTAYA